MEANKYDLGVLDDKMLRIYFEVLSRKKKQYKVKLNVTKAIQIQLRKRI